MIRSHKRCTLLGGLLLVLFAFAPCGIAQTDYDDLQPLDEKGMIQWDIPLDVPAPASTTLPQHELSELVYLPGRAMRCRNALAGALKACSKTFDGEQDKWWEIYKKNTRQGRARAAACNADDEKANYDGSANYQTLQKTMFSTRETVDGGGEEVPCGPDSVVLQTQNEFMEYERQEKKPTVGWIYNDEEFDLAVQRGTGECVSVGTKCSSGVLGYCIVEKEVYCCFNSPVSAALRKNLGNLGTADKPKCGGVPLQSAISASVDAQMVNEINARMSVVGYQAPFQDGHNMDAELFGAGNAIGNEGRKTLSERTLTRINEESNMGAASRALEAEYEKVRPTETRDDPTGAGTLTLIPGNTEHTCNRASSVSVRRAWGSEGPVSVTVKLTSRNDMFGTRFEPIEPTVLSWQDGEKGDKRVRFKVGDLTWGGVLIWFEMVNPTGGARIANDGKLEMLLSAGCSGSGP